jgi:hypothetical protein
MLQSILLLFLTIFMMLGCDSSESEPTQIEIGKTFTVYKGTINNSPVPINQKVYLEFSAPIDTATVNDSTAYMLDENNNSVGLYIGIGSPNTKIILTPFTFLEPSTLYTIIVTTGLQDINGRSLSEEYRYEFTTQADSVNSAPLAIKSFKPENGAAAALVQSEIAIDFSKNLSLEPQYTNVEYLSVRNQAGAPIEGKTEVFNSILKFIPHQPLPYEEKISVSLMTPVMDMFDNNFSDLSLASWSFTTKTEAQNPKVNLGFVPFSAATTSKHSYLVRMIYNHETESKIAVATQDGIDIYLVEYTPSNYLSLHFLHSYPLSSKINAMISFNEEYLLVGTISDGIYTLKVDAAGVSAISHLLSGENIQGVTLGHSGTVDRAYGVGPLLGLQVFNLDSTTGVLTLSNTVSSALLGEALDVAEATEYDNNASANVRKIYVADYNGSVVVCDENGTLLNRTDLNMSVKKLIFNEDYNGKLNLLAIGSSGKMQGLGFDGTLFSNVKLDLLSNIYDAKSYIDFTTLSSSIYLSGGSSGILVTSGDYPSSIISTSGNVVSTDVIVDSANSLTYLVALNDDGGLQIFNAQADMSAPYASTTPYNGQEVSANGFNFVTTFVDEHLDNTTVSKESFVFYDLNSSVAVPFTFDISGDEYKLTPISSLSPDTNYSVTIRKSVKDLMGNELNGGADTVVNFKTNSDIALPSLTINDISASEDNNLTFTITLSEVSSSDVTFNYATVGDSATDGIDYTSLSGTGAILAGELTTTVVVEVKDDKKMETAETLFLNLSNPSANAVISDNQGVGTILVESSSDTVRVGIYGASSVDEGGSITYTLATEQTPYSNLTLNIEVSHITTDSTDITPSTLSATIVPGNVNTTFSISNLDDTVEKTDNREYRVTITGVDSTDNGGYESITFDPSNNATRIIDNDTAGGAEVYLSLGNSSVDESQSMMGFNFFIEQAISSDITFNYATADNNATAGSDYESSSGLATITAGETVVVVFVPLLDDTIQEGNETFYLNISNVSANALAEISQSVGTIVDND